MTTLPGIDVSGIGQGSTFNWSEYRGRIAFAFVKATEGLSFVDPDYARNWAACAELGIVRGAYHFLHPDLSGGAQADFFLAAVTLRPGDLVMVDVETTKTATGAEVSPAQVSACVAAFADIIRAKTGAWPVVYTDQSMAYGGYLTSAGQCPAFIANPSQVQLRMPIGPWRLVSFMQVGQRGVDTDEFYGDLVELRRLTVSRPLPAPGPGPVPRPTPPPPPVPAGPAPILLRSVDGGQTFHRVSA